MLWRPRLALHFPKKLPDPRTAAYPVYARQRLKIRPVMAGIGLHRHQAPRVTLRAEEMCTALHDGPANILFFGCQGSGKQTLLSNIKENKRDPEEEPEEPPEVVEEDEPLSALPSLVKLYSQNIYTCEGLRLQLKFEYVRFCAVVWVVDSTAWAPLREAGKELTKAVAMPELGDATFLILASKRDCPEALPMGEVRGALEPVFKARRWALFPVSALTGQGLPEAFEWLSINIALDCVTHYRKREAPSRLQALVQWLRRGLR